MSSFVLVRLLLCSVSALPFSHSDRAEAIVSDLLSCGLSLLTLIDEAGESERKVNELSDSDSHTEREEAEELLRAQPRCAECETSFADSDANNQLMRRVSS